MHTRTRTIICYMISTTRENECWSAQQLDIHTAISHPTSMSSYAEVVIGLLACRPQQLHVVSWNECHYFLVTRLESKKQSRYLRHCHRPLNSQFLCERTKFGMCICVHHVQTPGSAWYGVRKTAAEQVYHHTTCHWHQGPVSWRPMIVKWRQFSQSNRHSTMDTRQTEYHEALPSSANVLSLVGRRW